MEAPDTVTEQEKLAATICSALGQQSSDSRDYDKAIRFYKEAANHDDSDGKVWVMLVILPVACWLSITHGGNILLQLQLFFCKI